MEGGISYFTGMAQLFHINFGRSPVLHASSSCLSISFSCSNTRHDMTHMVQSSHYFTNFSDRDIYRAIDVTNFADCYADSTCVL